ncbi:MAG: hypothetical protein DWQ05_03235 [Calditrichaeota bacterium]|nr:MAG: hypothetical protein DWQ05_03235 [Calditrichota bacterium]
MKFRNSTVALVFYICVLIIVWGSGVKAQDVTQNDAVDSSNISQKILLKKAITDLETIVESYSQVESVDLILFQLADFYIKKAEFESLSAEKKYNSSDIRRALELLNLIVRKYPQSRLADDAFYLIIWLKTGRKEKLLEELCQDFLAGYPESEFVPDVQLQLGDISFDRSDFQGAIRFYKKVSTSVPGLRLVQANLQIAMCYYSLNITELAITYFTQTLQSTAKLNSEEAPLATYLRKKAISFLASTFWDNYSVAGIDSFLRTQNLPAWGATLLQKTGEYYQQNLETVSEAIEVNRLLLKNFPNSYEAREARFQLLQLYSSLKATAPVFELINEILAHAEINFKDKHQKNLVLNRLKKQWLKNLDTSLQIAQSTDEPALYREYVDRSMQFLDYFAADSQAVHVHWNRALVLETKLGRYAEAFSACLRLCQETPGFDLTRAAALKAISLAGILQNRAGPVFFERISEKPPAGTLDIELIKNSGLSSTEEILLEAYENYILLFSMEDKTAGMLLEAGDFCLQRDNYLSALKYYKTYLRHFPDFQNNEDVQLKIAQIYFGLHDFHNVEIVAGRIVNSNDRAIRKEAQHYLTDSRYLKSNPLFDKEFPVVADSALELFKAGIRHAEENQFERAVQDYQNLLFKFPGWRYQKSTLKNLAIVYIKIEDWENAAQCFEMLSDFESGRFQQKRLLIKAARLYEADQKFKRATQVYEKFYSRFPDDLGAERVLYELVNLYKKQGDLLGAARAQNLHKKKFPHSKNRIRTLFAEADTLRWNLEMDQAATIYRQILGITVRDEQQFLPERAESYFHLNEMLLQNFLSIKFTRVQNNTAQNKQTKQKLLLEMVTRYTKIIKLNSVLMLESYHKIGFCYEKFADDWKNQTLDRFSGNEKIAELKKVNDVAKNIYIRAAASYLTMAGITGRSAAISTDNQVELRRGAANGAISCLMKAADREMHTARHMVEAPIDLSSDAMTALEYQNQVLNKIILPLVQNAISLQGRAEFLSDSLHIEKFESEQIGGSLAQSHAFKLQIIEKQLNKFVLQFKTLWSKFVDTVDSADKNFGQRDVDLTVCMTAIKGLLLQASVDDGLQKNVILEKKKNFYVTVLHSFELLLFDSKLLAAYPDYSMAKEEQLENLEEIYVQTLFDFYTMISGTDFYPEYAENIQIKLLNKRPNKFAEIFKLDLIEQEIVSDSTWQVFQTNTKKCADGMQNKVAVRESENSSIDYFGTAAKKIHRRPQKQEKVVKENREKAGNFVLSFLPDSAQIYHFTKSFHTAGIPVMAVLQFQAQDSCAIFVNGNPILPEHNFTDVELIRNIDISHFLKKGDNDLCIHARSQTANSGFLFYLKMQLVTGKLRSGQSEVGNGKFD